MKASCIEFSTDVEDVVIVRALDVLTSNFAMEARVNNAGHAWHNTFLHV